MNRENAEPGRSLALRHFILLLLLLTVALAGPDSIAATLRVVMDEGFVNLSWDAPDAKLEGSSALVGPWQTVNTTNRAYRLPPSSGSSRHCEFYRLKQPATGKKWLAVAAVTMTSTTNTEANLQTLYSYMEQAASNRADLIVFPEVALQGCPPWAEYSRMPTEAEKAYMRDTAETVPGPSTDKLVAKARDLGIYVVFGLTETDSDGKLYNASVFLGPDGVIGTHRKSIHVGNDGLIWTRGTNLIEVFDSPIGKAGMMICAEMGGEAGSLATIPGPRLAAAGADLLVTVSAWWSSVAFNYDPATNENARQANRWHVVADQVGRIGYAQTYGHSRVVDPLGRIVMDSGAKEGMAIWETDILIDVNP